MNSRLLRRFLKLGICIPLLFCTCVSAFCIEAFALNGNTDKIDAFYKAGGISQKIALTFDDGPLKGKTDDILDVLDEYGVKATFFMVGSQAIYCSDTAKRVVIEGHEIGNHTFNHLSLCGLNSTQLESEIEKCENAIYESCGYIPSLFRPPEGVCNDGIIKTAGNKGYDVVMWSIDTKDWQGKSASEIAETVISNVTGGAVVLMHDGIFSKSYTADALKMFIPVLLEKGYEFVTVGELLADYRSE